MITKQELTNNAVEVKDLQNVEQLASIENIVNTMGGCALTAGASISTYIQDKFPLTYWLMNTQFTSKVEAMIDNGLLNYHKDADGNNVINVPGEVFTVPNNQDLVDSCCFQPFDIAKCEGSVPLKMLCLKYCENIEDTLIYGKHKIGKDVDGLMSKNETVGDFEEKIAKLSFAFFQARNAIIGTTNASSEQFSLKPFHGLLEVMQNPAIPAYDAQSVGTMNAFDMIGCRLATLNDSAATKVFAVHPIIYRSLLKYVKRDVRGDLPEGWSKDGETIKYNGIPFVQDILVPYDIQTGLGEAWLLDGTSVGLIWGTSLVSNDPEYQRGDFNYGGASQCGADCKFFYNVGAVMANNANKFAIIKNIKVTANCAEGTKDLGELIHPTTLIPHIG